MLELQDVTVERAGRTLVQGIDLTVRNGRVTAVLGPNGAGKSTLIKALSGAWRLARGKALLDGQDIRRLPAPYLARRRAIVPQSTLLSFPFTALEVVMLGMTVPGFAIDRDEGQAVTALADVGLDDFAQRSYVELSGGERQRVHIARALCQLRSAGDQTAGTTTLLLDEPTSNLDPGHQTLVLNRLRREARDGRAVLIVLHDLNLAAAWADEIVLMSGGRIFAAGHPEDVFVDGVLSAAYGCPIRANALPANGSVFVLPHHARFNDSIVAPAERSTEGAT